jgi:hypothetical protein
VIPAEYIRETLMRDELVEDRNERDREAESAARRREEENAAVMDSLPPAVNTDEDRPESKKRRTDKFTLHPRGFEEAVLEIWEADPPEK